MRLRCGKALATCVGLALAELASPPASADAGEGLDATLGSALNLGLMRGSGLPRDPDEEPKRSPSGILYDRRPAAADKRARTAQPSAVRTGLSAATGRRS